MAIYFLRHGESEANVKGVFAGQRDDTPLTDYGREQAQDAAKDLDHVRIDKIITSDLKRAAQTADEVAKALGVNKQAISTDKRLQEYDMGELAGTPIRKVLSAELTTVKGAEDPIAFQARVLAFLREYKGAKENVLVVSHAAVGRIIETLRLGLDPKNFYDVPPYPNAEPVMLDLSWLD